MANAKGQVHVNNKLGSVSHIELFHSGGQFNPALNVVDSATGTETGSSDTFEWDGEEIAAKGSNKRLLIERTCATWRALTRKKKIGFDEIPTAGTVPVSLAR